MSALLLVVGMTVALPGAAAAATCTGNAIVCENQLPGTDPSVWDIQGAGDDSIQGFATQMSVNAGDQVQFKIKTDATAYSITIYRLGYYQGKGAREVATVTPSATLPQIQPACATDPATEIFDCGTWGVSASWAVPSTAVSGVYIALLERSDTNDSSHIPFIVRNDASHSDIVYQTSDTTWQAYNTYGGSDYYVGHDNGRAYKVSYNRPFATRSWEDGRDYLFSNEYPMIRFLESNGYDVSYISGLDTDIRGNLLTNHKAFLSVGHDEYWSAQQRTNVEAARDAGVNLAFFSGNEVYWKTRWEPSQDGTNTQNRTLVCYKDTWANAPIDPVDHTATWRDPRFGDNGHGPENALTGTIYMSNFTDLPLTVSADEGALRLWRNTGLDHPATGTSTQLAPHTVGYESDEDLDNGYRPAGLIRLSTTTGASPQYLTDFGNTVVAGTTTHHVTMYKAASGALVFGAGTVQWSWALDTYHDGTVSPVDTRMQQATINILADMGASATSLTTPGVVNATKSTDTVAPTAVITSPAAGANLTQGSTITVTGTATDGGGGVVAGVEVSLDGGATWHPATGRGSFSYSGVLTGTGSSVVRARAIDDSGNIQGSPATVNSTVDCPCSIFGSTVPRTVDANDASPVTLGVRFTSAADGFITGLRFYKATGNTGTHTGALYKSDGTVLSTVTYTNESASGWQTATFQTAVPISAGATYTASYVAPNGHYSADSQYFAYRGTTSGPLTALGSYANPNGVYTTGSGAPTSSYQQSNYYVDVVYSAVDTTPLTVVSTTPIDGASSVPTGSTISAVFSRDPIQNTISLTVTDPNHQSVQGTTAYDQATRTVTFTPSAPLATGTTYSASLTASAPNVGAMASPAAWSFKTALPDHVSGVCPCGLFNDSDTPVVPAANDPNSVELGIAFSPDMNGLISGVRFYKGAGNSGTHTVSLWSAAGNLLASAQVTQESTAGWQEATFSSPVSVTAGTSYIASYRAPNGRYSYTADGLTAPIVKAPLSTPANAGRYTYGTSAPLSTSSANYHVDPVFTVDASVLPVVSSATPPDRSTSVPTSATVLITFNTAVQPGSTSISLTDASGQAVPGTVSNQSFGSTAGFTPNSPLTASTTYTISVSGAKNLGGAAMAAPWTATFTTSGTGSCPCSVLPSYASPTVSDSGDGAAVSLGLQFKSDTNGFVTGLRYYRDAANTGTHSGTLYGADGTVLGTLTFQDGPAGWQTASFAHAVPVTAGTTYVASTFMPNGHYSYTSHFFDSAFVNSPLTGLMGTYAYGNAFPTSSFNNGNYYVDVSFSTTDPATVPAAPTNVAATAGNASASVTWTAPADGGSTITSYTVTPYQGSTALAPTVVSGSPAGTSATVTGLVNGTSYTFQVTATNAVGTGPASAASGSVTPAPAVPDAPTGVSAVAGDGSATVSWTAPASNGGSPITGYTVTPYIGTTAQPSTSASGSGAVVSGLANGTAYTFTVAATNAVGTGPASSPSASVTPSGPRNCPCSVLPNPSSPTVSDSGDGAAVSLGLQFKSDTNGFITGLRYYRDSANTGTHNGTLYAADGTVLGTLTFQDGAAGWQTASFAHAVPVTAGTTYVASTFMPNGHYSYTSHFFDSAFVNSPLTGLMGTYAYGNAFPASSFNNGNYFVDVSFSTTDPATVPAAPTNVAATAGNQSASVTWAAPADGGSTITSYSVTPYQGTTALAPTVVSGSPAGTSATVNGLVNGTSYTFQVTATNRVGTGAAGVSEAVVPATVPDAPTNVTATAGNEAVDVGWTAPASDGGQQITQYTITPFVGSAAQSATVVPASATKATVSGLVNGTTYTFTVTASNTVGSGPASTPSGGVTPFAPAFVQQQNARSSSVTSVTATPTANLTAGNRLVVMVGVKGTATTTAQSVSDSAGNTYVKITQFRAADSTEMSVWTAPITAGGGTTPVVTAASSESATMAISVLEYTGLSAATDLSAVDQAQTATGTTSAAGTVQSGPTGPTSAAGELAVGFYLDGGVNQAVAAGSGYTERVNGSPNNSMQYLIEDQVTGPAGAVADAGFQAGASTTWLAATVVFVRGA